MTASNRILAGLISGIGVGISLGEYARIFDWAADGFIKLMQMTVLPSVTVSIVASLGSLRLDQAKMLGRRAGLVLVTMWALALTFALAIPLAFPRVEQGSFFSTTLVEEQRAFNFIDLFVPSNPFHSLANNVVPAVVLFAVVLGLALIGMEGKQTLLDVLGVLRVAISRVTRFVVSLTPYGIFAIAATAAGTLDLSQVEHIEVYLVAYVAVALFVTFWVLPGLVAALTPIRARDMLSTTRDATLTAFLVGDLFIVLPAISEASRRLLLRDRLVASDDAAITEIIVPTSFNFPHTGKLLSLSFVLFAGWFADADVPVTQYPELALAGLVTFFGSLNAAVPFLLDLFRIPADTFQLFVATSVVNARFGSLLAAMHTVTIALLGTCAVTGALRVQPARLLRYGALTVVLGIVTLAAIRLGVSTIVGIDTSHEPVISTMRPLLPTVDATVHREMPVYPAETSQDSNLDLIRRRGVLRVGYLADGLPFAFFNDAGMLVGFDIDMAHALAREMRLRVDFVPVDRDRLAATLKDDLCDIVMTGVVVTTLRASNVLFSNSYLDETLALVVRDHERHRFATWREIRARRGLAVAVPNLPYYIDKVRELLPDARIQTLRENGETFRSGDRGIEAVVLPAERASAWTLIYPQFTVVVPQPVTVRIPLAYPVGRNDERFVSFVNTWLELKRKDGTIDALYRYWILGQNAKPPEPRWSVIRNVLHWVG